MSGVEASGSRAAPQASERDAEAESSAPTPAPAAAVGSTPAPAPTAAVGSAPERPSPPPSPAPVLSVRGLTVESLRGRSLVEVFREAELSLYPDEVVLLVGPSGSGKSLFAKLLAGLLGPGTDSLHIPTSARLEVGLRDGSRHEVLGPGGYPPRLRGTLGYMFQHHALFDELTVRENIELARDQAPTPRRGAAWTGWLERTARGLKLDRLLESPIEPLSGGQRQRAALLRMLALDPEILVYDEPTSGLDPDAARRVAQLIRGLQHPDEETDGASDRASPTPQAPADAPARPRPRLSLVVTHDYEHLLQVADRVVVLNARRGFTVYQVASDPVREEVREQVIRTLERFEAPRPRAVTRSEQRRLRQEAAWRRAAAFPGGLWDAVRRAPRRYVRSWRWHARFLRSLMRLLVIDAVPFVALGGAAVGLVLSYFSLNALPHVLQTQAEPVFLEEMIRTLGVALFQIIAPLFTAICLAARSGAAVSGYVASLERSSQLDALRVLGMPPAALLADKIVLAFVLGLPLLTAVTFVVGSLSTAGVLLLTRPLATGYTFWESYFQGLGRHPFDLPYWKSGWVLAKLIPAGFLMGIFSWRIGAAPKETSADVNRAITWAIMAGILSAIAVFFVVLLFEIGHL